MNNPIMMTPHDIFNIILTICGAVITVSGAMVIILKMIEKAKEPEKNQNERLNKLEEEVKEIQTRLEDGNNQFKATAERIDEVENAMKQSNKIIIESLQKLIEHGIDGNNTDGLKSQKHRIDEYLLDKKYATKEVKND